MEEKLTLEQLEQMLEEANDKIEAIEEMIEDYWQQDQDEMDNAE